MRKNTELLRLWCASRYGNQDRAAAALGIRQAFLSHLMSGRRLPSLKTATAIEKATQDWDEGPIRAVDWLTPHDTQSNGAEQMGESQ